MKYKKSKNSNSAVPRGNKKGRGPGFPIGGGSDSSLPQHGGEGKNLSTSKSKKAGLNKGMSGDAYCGPGRYL